MIENIKFKEASKREITLYTILGESLCAVQILEDALSHSIVLKKTEPDQKNEADNLLKKQRKYTLGLPHSHLPYYFSKHLGFELEKGTKSVLDLFNVTSGNIYFDQP